MPNTIRGQIRLGVYGDHARHLENCTRIDALDLRMRMQGPHNNAPGLSCDIQVIGIDGGSCQETMIFETGDGTSHECVCHGASFRVRNAGQANGLKCLLSANP